jgi:hypothetical protein
VRPLLLPLFEPPLDEAGCAGLAPPLPPLLALLLPRTALSRGRASERPGFAPLGHV